MPYTRKQVVTCISILYLILLTALAGYATSRLTHLSIPISNSLAYATTLLPLISGILLEASYDITRQQERRARLPQGTTPRPPLVVVANTAIFIYSSVVITLLGTHAAPPSGLDCGLRARWTTLFRRKKVDAVRTIQQAFDCCGFKNSRDMAWPFPDKTHDALSCEKTFGHTEGCLGPWRGEEQRMAGLLMGVVGLVFVWQFAIIAIPTQRESWLHRIVPDRVSRLLADEEHGGGGGGGRSQGAIDYLPNFNRYSDRVEEDAGDGDGEAENGPRRAIEGNTQHGKNNRLGGRGDDEEQRQRQRQPQIENEWARN